MSPPDTHTLARARRPLLVAVAALVVAAVALVAWWGLR